MLVASARFALAWQYLPQTGKLVGIGEAHDHLCDMMRLSRSDNLGVRDMLPALMLRLDLDHECYDFVKWWATCDPDGDYDWADMTLPYLNIRGADVFEEPEFLCGPFADLNQLIAVLMLKLKLLVDISTLKITRQLLQSRLPAELWTPIEREAVRSPLAVRLLTQSPTELARSEHVLLSHALRIGATIVKTNSHFMFNLFEPDEALAANPQYSSDGSWEEMALAIQHSYPAWLETERVLAILTDARRIAAQDFEDEISDMMESETFEANDGADRTAEELLADVSVNRVWGYLDDAMENAAYLGPRSELPSDRRMRMAREAQAEDEEFDDSLDPESGAD